MPNLPVIGIIETPERAPNAYEEVASHVRFWENPPDGMVLHFAGSVPSGWLTLSAWREKRCADDFLADRLGASIADRAAIAAQPDITYVISPMFRLMTGRTAREWIGNEVGRGGDAIGFCFASEMADAMVYRDAVDALAFEDSPPQGLITHVAGPFAEAWRIFDVWESHRAAKRHYEGLAQRFAAAELDPSIIQRQRVTRIDLHTLTVCKGGLDELPRFQASPQEWNELTVEPLGGRLHFDQQSPGNMSQLERLLQD